MPGQFSDFYNSSIDFSTLSQVSQLPLVLQSQQHYFDFGVGIQNDVVVYDVLAQIWQARLRGKLLNSPCRAQSLLRRMKASGVMRINKGDENGQTRNY